jgi:hemerythrin superfamily protein
MDMPLRRKISRFSPPITKMIRTDHSHVMVLSHKYTANTSPQRKKAIVSSICLALEIHAQLEEEIFYPALREVDPNNDVLAKAQPEHDAMRRLIEELRQLDPNDPRHDKTFHQLMRDVMHHVADEEAELLPRAEHLLAARLNDLGARMTRRRLQLARPHLGEMAVHHARAMPTSTILMAGGLVLTAFLLTRAWSEPRYYR